MLMARDLIRAADPVEIMRDGGIEPDPWQADALRETCGRSGQRLLMVACRQAGKTETAICAALWSCLYDPGLVIIASPSLRQSSELFRRLMTNYHLLDGVVPLTQESALTATFANGARAVSLPASEATVRGLTGAKLLLIDEGARVPDALYVSLRPALATVAGSIVAMSTPAGRKGWLWRAWEEGGADWRRIKVTAHQVPRLSPEFLAEELREMGPLIFSQEYEPLDFVDDDQQVFATELIDAAFEAGQGMRSLF